MGIATSQSHSEVLQDMVLSLSGAEGKRDIEHEKNLLKDLVKEMVQFRCAMLGIRRSFSELIILCCVSCVYTLFAGVDESKDCWT